METIVSSNVNHAADVIKQGGIVIFPTETVYGIGANSRNILACEKIYSIKNRPSDNPFIVHLDSVQSIDKIAIIPEKYKKVIHHFSPGPITYILEKKDDSIFSSGLSTLAVRVPSHEMTNLLLQYSDTPISAPSANLSGKPSITRSLDAISEFSGKVDFILTGKDSEIGIESTVLDFTSETPVLVRPGRISYLELKDFLPNLKTYEKNNNYPLLKPISPGLKYRHYAPDCRVILVESIEQIEGNSNAVIGFKYNSKVTFSQFLQTNLEYMHYLYSFFIDCDKKQINNAFCQFPLEDEFKDVLINRIEKAIMK
ncbi:MAG: threonylcarbamoyl-AMP synthase [Leptospiraceae bacterium]|nr:threonylcarbamoyl-AMP synthase [Leptospiraceae bacterium]